MDSGYGQCYEDLYRNHWWWRAREEVLLRVIGSLAIRLPAEILDVGCGNGLFFPHLGRLGKVCGIETDRSLIPENSPWRARIYHQPLGDPVYRDMRFDLITALDVVEHIEDDQRAIGDMLAMLRPGGKLLITVPALMALWDRHDEINCHYRRYRIADLRRAVPPGANILDARYLFHFLVVPKLIVKLVNRWFPRPVAQHGLPPPLLNRLLELLCVFEYRSLRRLRIPFGTSILAVVEKAVMP